MTLDNTVCLKGPVKKYLPIARDTKQPITQDKCHFLHQIGTFLSPVSKISNYHSEIIPLCRLWRCINMNLIVTRTTKVVLEAHKYEDIENAIKIKDQKILQENQNDNFSVAKCRIYLKPCFSLEFVCFLETYLRKLINFDHGGPPEDSFSPRVPKMSPFRGPFGRP